MQRIHGDLFFSPSDLNHFVECEHLTTLDLLAVDGLGPVEEKDPQAEIVRAKGFEHERGWLEHLRSLGKEITVIADGDIDWPRDAGRTSQAMRDGADSRSKRSLVASQPRSIVACTSPAMRSATCSGV